MSECAEFVNKIKNEMLERPDWFSLSEPYKARDKDVDIVEKKLGIILPKSYKCLVLNFSVGDFAFQTIYSLWKDSEFNLLKINQQYSSLAKGFILFSDNEVGDGTTSVVVLAGALLEHAESLILQNVHPTIIVDGYKKAGKKAKQYLKEIAEQVAADDKPTLLKIANTSMQTKLIRKQSDDIGNMVVEAVLAVAEKIGVSWMTVHRWEHEQRTISEDKLERISKLYGKSIRWFLTIEEGDLDPPDESTTGWPTPLQSTTLCWSG